MNNSRHLPGLFGAAAICSIVAGALLWSASQRTVYDDPHAAHTQSPKLPDMRLDLNNATVDTLRVLPGIGERLAERIVEDRDLNGRFQSIDDLARVDGIGPITIERITPWVVVEIADDE